MSRRALALGAAAVCAATALVCAGLAAADSPPVTTTDTTSTDTTATATTQTTDTTTTTQTVTAPTDPVTTSSTTTTPGTTSTAATTATTTATKKKARPRSHEAACVGAGSLLLLLPGHAPQSVGSVAARVPAGAGATPLRYPENGRVLRVASERADVSGCAHGTQPATATSSLRRLSLFDGEISVVRLVATLVPAKSPGRKWRLRTKVKNLVVDGKLVRLHGRASVRVGNWGRLKLDGRHAPRPKRSATVGLGWWASGLSLRLTAAHAGLPKGALLLIGYVAADRPYAPRPAVVKGGVPLTVTPPLKAGPYTFPVAGDAFFSDTYGANRSDVPGGWHHGDDIFSPLGQPVLAVADGRVYKVGWNRVGGWRLWLKDAQGNRFYYAHLSGYTKYGRNGTHVKAGQQLAFIGNTGDAFTTPHHLHFEIHPVKLLHLHYAGAVDPTTYLDQWRRVEHVTPLAPIPLPAGAATHGDGAVTDYRELLAVRGIRRPPSSIPFPLPLEGRPIPIAAAAGLASTSTSFPLVPAISAALVALFGVAGLVFWKRRRVPDSAG